MFAGRFHTSLAFFNGSHVTYSLTLFFEVYRAEG